MKKYLINVVLGLGFFLCAGTMASCGDSKMQPTETAEEQQTEESEEQIVQNSNGISYQWQEITFALPQEWAENCVILEVEQGVEVYQKKSYEKAEGMGYLFGVIRSEDWLNYGTGEQMIAYTEDGTMYYLMRPTDMPADVENEETLSEYMTMAEQISQIARSVQIDVQGVRYDAGQFVIPFSSIKSIEEENLSLLSDNELWIARNEIYARHGKVFENIYLQSYFDSCSWYMAEEGKNELPDSELSEIERANLEKIVAAEKSLAAQYPYPKEYRTDTVVQECLTGAEELNTISYTVTPEGDDYRPVLTIDGTEYDLSEDIYMVSPDTEVFYITNFVQLPGTDSEDEDGLEIAVLDYGPSNDLETHFFKYDGTLRYIGGIEGFPFKEQNNGRDGFNHQGGVTGTVRSDLIETAYLDGYWWYDSENQELIYMETGLHTYQYFKPHELLIDLPVYQEMRSDSDVIMMQAQKEVYFLKSDLQEWIYVRAKDGTEGYIQVKDEEILNAGKSAQDVFTELNYFD